MMTRKNFEAVAKVLNFHVSSDADAQEVRQWIVSELAEVFEADSPDFDRIRFMKACGF